MTAGKVAAIFDVGKTNKKLLLFNEEYQLVKETSVQLPQTTDEDGFACEDVHALTNWVITNFEELSMSADYHLAALNFSSYGASFVHLDKSGEPCCPLYNYLKPYPDKLKSAFYNTYGGEEAFSMLTASPVLGSLNSGMQLYRLKHEQPDLYSKIRYSLHLPQYLNYILSGKTSADITSIGCHTNLWNFRSNSYHQWVNLEKIDDKLAPVVLGDALVNDPATSRQPPIGVGLHDSSAALIPYLQHFRDPFILISTGTWCISMNPFNNDPLTLEELRKDCLCYLTYQGEPVKSSRLFAGNEHEKQIKRLGDFFHIKEPAFSEIRFNKEIYDTLVGQFSQVQPKNENYENMSSITSGSAFSNRDLAEFPDYETAYHQLMIDIMVQQVASTTLVINTMDKSSSDNQTTERNSMVINTAGANTRNQKTGEKKNEDINTDNIKTEDIKTEDIKSENIKSEDMKTEKVKTENMKTEDMKTEDMKTENMKTGVMKTAEIKTREIKQIFVDGGFSKNEIYMNLLSMAFPGITVSAATVPQSTGLGAALAIHKHWNKNPIPQNLIQLKTYHPKSFSQ